MFQSHVTLRTYLGYSQSDVIPSFQRLHYLGKGHRSDNPLMTQEKPLLLRLGWLKKSPLTNSTRK